MFEPLAERGGVAGRQFAQNAGDQPRLRAGQGEQSDIGIGGGEDGSQGGVVEEHQIVECRARIRRAGRGGASVQSLLARFGLRRSESSR